MNYKHFSQVNNGIKRIPKLLVRKVAKVCMDHQIVDLRASGSAFFFISVYFRAETGIGLNCISV